MANTKATHIDYTTLMGAARAIESTDLKLGLPLSRLLSLSQFIEAIVLQERLTYELGTSEVWRPYVEALQSSFLLKIIGKMKWLNPLPQQVDEDDEVTAHAVKWAVDKLETTSMESLLWSVKFRSSTYTDIAPTGESNSPFVKRYLDIANSMDTETVGRFRTGIARLNNNEVGPLGFSILVRLGLFNEALVQPGKGSYSPHYSRQPVILSAEGGSSNLNVFSMDQLAALHKDILLKNDNKIDILSLALSPIFLAALSGAKKPEDVIENALIIRESKHAKMYRKEVTNITTLGNSDTSAIELYKTRIRSRIANLNDFMFEKGINESYYRSWVAKLGKGFPLGWMFGWRKSFKKFTQPGDSSVLFFSDLMSQAIGVTKSQQKIHQIFGVTSGYDMPVISCASPDYRRRKV